MTTRTDPNQHQKGRTKLWSKILAWLGFFFGAIAMFGSVVGKPEDRLGGILVALAVLIPPLWWFYCEKQDSDRREAYEADVRRNQELTKFLSPQDQFIADGMGGVEAPKKFKRRWPLVALISFVVLLLGGLLLPPVETSPESSTETPNSTTVEETTSSLTTTTSATEDVKESEEARHSEEAKQSEDSRRSAEAKARQQEEARQAEERRLREQAEAEQAEAEQARLAEQQAVAPAEPNTQPQGLVAPVPQQRTTYANCKDVWNSIGRPIYAGEPGYTSGRGKLDGDSDGVACENDPR